MRILAVDVENSTKRCGEELLAEGLQSLGGKGNALYVKGFEPAEELGDREPCGQVGRRIFPKHVIEQGTHLLWRGHGHKGCRVFDADDTDQLRKDRVRELLYECREPRIFGERQQIWDGGDRVATTHCNFRNRAARADCGVARQPLVVCKIEGRERIVIGTRYPASPSR